MSEDQFQRQVDFILEQQAKFSTDIARLEENIARHEQFFAKLGDMILSLANYNEGQDERIAAQDRQIAAHDRQIAALIEISRGTDRRFKETDERINALIILAERFFNGNGQLPSNE